MGTNHIKSIVKPEKDLINLPLANKSEQRK
jgi:hypothetical protein